MKLRIVFNKNMNTCCEIKEPKAILTLPSKKKDGSFTQTSFNQKASKIILIGNPNVGKSALFNQLTKRYVTVSNYPGTTVTLSKGLTTIQNKTYEVIDTPGIYSLLPMTEDERVTRNILFANPEALILHVMDAKNIDRMLGLSLQLLDLTPKICIALNIMDEAEKLGIQIHEDKLSAQLQIPCVKTISTSGWGVDQLKEKIHGLA